MAQLVDRLTQQVRVRGIEFYVRMANCLFNMRAADFCLTLFFIRTILLEDKPLTLPYVKNRLRTFEQEYKNNLKLAIFARFNNY